MYGRTDIQTDTTLIAISPKPFGQGIKNLFKNFRTNTMLLSCKQRNTVLTECCDSLWLYYETKDN